MTKVRKYFFCLMQEKSARAGLVSIQREIEIKFVSLNIDIALFVCGLLNRAMGIMCLCCSSESLEHLVGLGLQVSGNSASSRLSLGGLIFNFLESEVFFLASLQQVNLNRVVPAKVQNKHGIS